MPLFTSSYRCVECRIEGPEVVGHGEDLGISWAINKSLKDFKQRIDGVWPTF